MQIIALIIPFRDQKEQDRRSQLRAFEKHMATFLRTGAGRSRYVIVVVEQSNDSRAFNRGQLLNVGFREAQKQADPQQIASACFHDVDLLPSDGLFRFYEQPPEAGRPTHIAGPSTWGKYAQGDYSQIFFGGVTALHPADFERANGYPNDYWGWGMEDDQLRVRVDAVGALKRGVLRPPTGAGRYNDIDQVSMLTFMQSRETLIANANRFNQKMFDPKFEKRTLDPGWRRANGLKGLAYEVRSRTENALSANVDVLHVAVQLCCGDADGDD